MKKTDEAAAGRGPMAQAADPARIVRERIEANYDDLRVSVELHAWKFGLGRTREEIRDVAEEVSQETVARVLQKVEAYDPERPMRAWMLGFAFNILRERRDRTIRDRRHRAEPARSTDDDAKADDLIARLEDLKTANDLRLVELLESVAPNDRTLLSAKYVDQRSAREIADTLDISEGAVRVRLSRALANLRAAYHAWEGTHP